jgi:hypothetical protein
MAQISYAQRNESSSQSKITYGIKAGLNISSIYDTNNESFDADHKLGLAAGVFVSMPLGRVFGFHPEVLFSQKGYKTSGAYLGVIGYEFTRTSNFLDIPLMIAFKPTSVFTVVAGPQISYLMYQKDVFTSGELSEEQTRDFENDNLRKNTLCFLGGFDLNAYPIVIGARAGWDVQNNNGDGTSTDPRYKNVWYRVSIGYRFQ